MTNRSPGAHESSLVSVVIPAYNASRTLTAAVESVLAQTYRPIEVIVVDDGSADDTADVAAGYGPPVRCERQSNAGDAAARNRGIRAAQGQFVAFLDADDLWKPKKLGAQMRLMEADPSIGAVQCGAVFVDDELRALEVRPCASGRTALWDVLRFRNLPALSSSLLARRRCFDEIGLIDTSVGGKDEWDLAIRLARFCGLWSVAEPLVLRRVHATSASRGADYAERQIAPGLEILRRLFSDASLPAATRRRRGQAYGTFYTMIAGSYFQAGALGAALSWAARAVRSDPTQLAYLAALPIRRLQRFRSRRRVAAA